MAQSNVFNCDCVEYMRTLPDGYFDLCIADPPYGDAKGDTVGGVFSRADGRFGERFKRYFRPTGNDSQAGRGQSGTENQSCLRRAVRPIPVTGGGVEIPSWDVAPNEEYFREMFRVSRNQIIWGGNYFSLPPTRCFLVWRKTNIAEDFTMAMAEYAWTSFNSNAKIFSCSSLRTDASGKFHPTEKRIELYRWILERYAKPGYKIFDPNMGSQNSRIAAYLMDYDYWGCEIDKYYFDEGCKNFERIIHGIQETSGGKTLQQLSLFD